MQEVATANEVGQHSDDEDVIDGQYGDAYQILEDGKMSVGTCQVHVCSFLKQFVLLYYRYMIVLKIFDLRSYAQNYQLY